MWTVIAIVGVVTFGVSMVLVLAWMLGAIRAKATNDGQADECDLPDPWEELPEADKVYLRWWSRF